MSVDYNNGQRNVFDDVYDYDDWMYIMLENLPTVAECIQAIVRHAPNYGAKKQKDHIHQFALRLYDLWQIAFGRDVVLVSIRGIKDKLDRQLKHYRTKVQKGRGSKRANMIQWKNDCNMLFGLLGTGVDPEMFDDAERAFYKDQVNMTRIRRIDTFHVDVEYESRVQEAEVQRLEEEMEIDEVQYATGDDDIMESTLIETESNLNFALNRSGLIRNTQSTSEMEMQTEVDYHLRQDSRNFHDSIKIALAASCAAANISPHQARVAFQVTSEKFFGVKYLLSPDYDTNLEPECKKNRTKEQYSANYKDVLPSAKTIMKMKHLMAIQEERNAALALLDTVPSDVVTVHYDTTTRKRLNGEWPALVLRTSSGKVFRLRSLNMAVEDRNNIVKLFLVTLNRLSLTVNTDRKLLWEKITAIMTDSVVKNLQIENLIAASLTSQHIPLHLLCVSHTCEVFDTGNLCVLKHVEEKLDMKNKILKCMPSLRSFMSKALIPAVIVALCKLVSNDGHKSSIYEEFDEQLCALGKSKKFSLFKERRFALLGYSAAALVHHIDDLKNTLENTGSNNQLVQACELYLGIDYIEIALKCIAWFTYKITLPFLNMCELETPKDLLSVLPTLHEDLSNCKMDSLKEYIVSYSFTVKKPTSQLSVYILERFCKQAAIDLARQRGREFGFIEGEQRATDLTKVDEETLEKLPVHNLICERDLSHMDKIAIRAAACSNRHFTAKSMRDDMTLYQSNITTIEKATKSIAKMLDEEERTWFETQREITKKKLAEKRVKSIHLRERVERLLNKCKNHGGPFTSITDIENGLKNEPDEKTRKQMLRNELLFRKHVFKRDYQEFPDLYKVNSKSVAEMKVNLAILLSGDHENDCEENIEFPNEVAMLNVLENNDDATSVESTSDIESEIPLNELHAVVWDESSGREWCLGMTKAYISEDEYEIDYLERDPMDTSKKLWRYPKKEAIYVTKTVQVIACNVIGAWDMTRRKPTFLLDNWEIIDGLFQSLYM